MATPIIDNDPEKVKLLEERIKKLFEDADRRDISFADALAQRVVREAAKFFAYCPNDFCYATGAWYDGHLVFGGTNRLHWSFECGFWPSREHCTPTFLKQFEGEVWEPIGHLDESFGDPPQIIVMAVGHMDSAIYVPVAHPLKHHAILGRKDKRGSGKIAEVRFLTGVEA